MNMDYKSPHHRARLKIDKIAIYFSESTQINQIEISQTRKNRFNNK